MRVNVKLTPYLWFAGDLWREWCISPPRIPATEPDAVEGEYRPMYVTSNLAGRPIGCRRDAEIRRVLADTAEAAVGET